MKLFAIDAIGNLVVFAIFWYWLGIPVANAGQLSLLVILALILAAAVAALFGLAFTRDGKMALRRIPAYLAWMLVAAALLMPLRWLSSFTTDGGLVIGSWLTFQMRMAIAPETVTNWLNGTLLLTGAALILLVAMPTAARISEQGFGGLRTWRPLLKPGYLAECVVYVMVGVAIPLALFQWIPPVKGLPAQSVSLAIRLLAAFVLYVAGWLEFARRCRRQTLAPEG